MKTARVLAFAPWRIPAGGRPLTEAERAHFRKFPVFHCAICAGEADAIHERKLLCNTCKELGPEKAWLRAESPRLPLRKAA